MKLVVSLKKIKTVWKYSRETEVQRLAQIAAQVGKRFYDKNGFLVLPFPVRNDPKTIFLPQLNYPKNLFKKTAKLKLSIPMRISIGLLKTLESLLEKFNEKCSGGIYCVLPYLLAKVDDTIDKKRLSYLGCDKSHHYNSIEKISPQKLAWEKVEKSFWKLLNDFIPGSKKIKQLEVWPTQFGSICSFWKEKDKIYIWLRLDADISHIAEGVISSLIKANGRVRPCTSARSDPAGSLTDYSWNEKEAIVDFLLSKTFLKNLFPKYKLTLSALRIENKLLKEKSDKYLESLGIKIGEIFKIKEGRIYYNNKLLHINLFSKKETKLLKLFIKNKNQLINFDQIAAVLWKKNTEEKFSLWAISKTIERLRKKFTKLNLSPKLLQTKRREGYFLAD